MITGVSVLAVQGEEVVVSGALTAGTPVIVTPMPEAIEGMRVRVSGRKDDRRPTTTAPTRVEPQP